MLLAKISAVYAVRFAVPAPYIGAVVDDLQTLNPGSQGRLGKDAAEAFSILYSLLEGICHLPI